MSTKACLFTLNEADNKFMATIVNYDGYPEHLGKILPKYFQDNTLAYQLIHGGEIRFISKEGDVEYYKDVKFYPMTFMDTKDMDKELGWVDYKYYYSNSSNGWYIHCKTDGYVDLEKFFERN